ncbi:MAG TPA: S41 family peptidase [Micropepsaceae bacterium]|nr:S41 family peptidase [Micropepsaceae bacterium]
MFFRQLMRAAAFAGALLMPHMAMAQDTPPPVPEQAQLDIAIEKLATSLASTYTDAAKAEELAARVRARHAEGAYAGLNIIDLAELLTADMRGVVNDKHMAVRAVPPGMTGGADAPEVPQEIVEAAMRERMGFRNYEIINVQRLDGNIGYLEIRGFPQASPELRARYAAAFELLKDTDGLIIDVRRNGGGDPNAVALLMSFLVEGRVHINSFIYRDASQNEEFWSDESAGPKYGKPVAVLISAYTFSGGEEFAYDVQSLQRGRLFGRTTGGGANPVSGIDLIDGLVARIPFASARNPITGANWEGVGVKPEVDVDADVAFYEAHIFLLQSVLEVHKARGQRMADAGMMPADAFVQGNEAVQTEARAAIDALLANPGRDLSVYQPPQ